MLKQKVLATGLVLATRRVELSGNEDLSGVMQNDTDPDQHAVNWELERAGQLE